jgi:hypothetical protein
MTQMSSPISIRLTPEIQAEVEAWGAERGLKRSATILAMVQTCLAEARAAKEAPAKAPVRRIAPAAVQERPGYLPPQLDTSMVPVRQPFNRAEYLAKMAAEKAKPTPPPKRR